jgi:ribosomal protein S18 acetylase RimI-like enzyme
VDTDLARIAEGLLLDYDPHDMPADIELVERDDLIMWTRPSTIPWMSTVRLARWSAAEAEERIDEVLALFRERRRSFVWHIGPSSAPADLADRLLRRGLEVESDTRLLVARLPVTGLRRNTDLRIVDARTADEVAAYLRFARRDWEDPELDDDVVAERMRSFAVYGERMGNVVGYLGAELVANAAWRDSSDGRALYLSGGGTLPEHRRKGIYQTLVAYRLERAARRGCSYAVIQARADTSLPILLGRGFTEVARVPVLMHIATSSSR